MDTLTRKRADAARLAEVISVRYARSTLDIGLPAESVSGVLLSEQGSSQSFARWMVLTRILDLPVVGGREIRTQDGDLDTHGPGYHCALGPGAHARSIEIGQGRHV